MNFSPSALQLAAIALSAAIPALLYLSRIVQVGAGTRFLGVSIATLAIYGLICLMIDEPVDSILSGALLLSTAIIFWYVIWGLLAFGFTITLLTSIAKSDETLSEAEWIGKLSASHDPSTFGRNRIQLLLNAALIKVESGSITVTRRGLIIAKIARFTKLVTGAETH